MTQADLAGEHFSKSYISQIEAGAVNPSLRALSIIAERLGVPVQELVQGGLTEDAETVLAQLDQAVEDGDADLALQLEEKVKESLHGTRSNDPRVLRLLAACAIWRGIHHEARELLVKAAEQPNLLPEDMARIWNSLASVYATEGDWASASLELERANQVVETTPVPLLLHLRVQTNHAIILSRLGQYGESQQRLEKVLTLAESKQTHYRIADILMTMGINHRQSGKPEQALAYYDAAIELCSVTSQQPILAAGLTNKAIALRHLGRHQEAVELLQRAIREYENLGERSAGELAESRLELALTYQALHEYERAYETVSKAIASLPASRVGNAYQIAFRSLFALRDVDRLARAAEAAVEHLRGAGLVRDEADIAAECGKLLLELNAPAQAAPLLVRSLDLMSKERHPE